jgi:hypothetical protein
MPVLEEQKMVENLSMASHPFQPLPIQFKPYSRIMAGSRYSISYSLLNINATTGQNQDW